MNPSRAALKSPFSATCCPALQDGTRDNDRDRFTEGRPPWRSGGDFRVSGPFPALSRDGRTGVCGGWRGGRGCRRPVTSSVFHVKLGTSGPPKHRITRGWGWKGCKVFGVLVNKQNTLFAVFSLLPRTRGPESHRGLTFESSVPHAAETRGLRTGRPGHLYRLGREPSKPEALTQSRSSMESHPITLQNKSPLKHGLSKLTTKSTILEGATASCW